ncbi:MAG: YkuS family protein [Clostridia bacterium]|nr:YkuS family protein [Clostridia bacterium]
MKHRIAVEPNLTPVREYLSQKGFEVESINFDKESSKIKGDFDAFVVTGLDTNSLGYNDTTTKAPVINASGLTAEEVYQELQNRLL